MQQSAFSFVAPDPLTRGSAPPWTLLGSQPPDPSACYFPKPRVSAWNPGSNTSNTIYSSGRT